MSTNRQSIACPDGQILHRAGEFIFAPKEVIQQLYPENRLGYRDAVVKLVQVLCTTDQISVRRVKTFHETTERLRTKLQTDGKISDEFPLEDAERQRIRELGMRRLKNDWKKICDAIGAGTILAGAVNGLLKRECRIYWWKEEGDFDDSHYVLGSQRLLLPKAIRLDLADEITRFGNQQGKAVPDRARLEEWIERVITTHYCIFEEYWQTKSDEYIPWITRSELPFLQKQDEGLSTSIDCIVAYILKKSRVNKRSDLLKACLDFSATTKGKKLFGRYDDLRASWGGATKAEQRDLTRAIKGIVDGGVCFPMWLGTKAVEFAGKLRSGREVGTTATLRNAWALRWLFRPARVSVARPLFRRLEELTHT